MMPKTFPVLSSPRMLLRELTVQDASDFHQLANFPDHNLSLASVREKIQEIRTDFENGHGISWAMIYDDSLIGTIGYYRGFENQTGEVGFVLLDEFRRMGFMSEALGVVLEFGFQVLRLQKIEAFTKPDNLPTIKLLSKHNFVPSKKQHQQYAIFEKLHLG